MGLRRFNACKPTFTISTSPLLCIDAKNGGITSVSQGGLARGYGYNENGYLTVVTNPETGATVYGRDASGNMTSKTVGASGITNYAYDDQNRLTSVVYPGGNTPTVTNFYTKTNRLSASISSTASKYYTYTENGNILSESSIIDGYLFDTVYAYSYNDQLTGITYPNFGSIITYTLDVLGRPKSVSGYITNVDYWPSGQIKQIKYGNGTVTNYDQNTRLWPSSFTTQKNTGESHSNSTYEYDGTGNITKIDDTIDLNYNRTLGYDGINRITSAVGPWGSGSIAYTIGGNITRQVFGGVDLSYTYDGNNRLNRVSTNPTGTFSYDSYGNIINDGVNIFNYDEASNLKCINCITTANTSGSNIANAIGICDFRCLNRIGRIDSPGITRGIETQFTYDGSNQRISVSKNGLKTYEVYDSRGNLLVSESTQGSITDLTEFFYLGGKRVAQKQTSGYRNKATLASLVSITATRSPNQTVVLTVIVTGSNLTGNVIFYNGTTVIGSAPIVNGQAVLDTGLASIDGMSISASYKDIYSLTTNIEYKPINLAWLNAILDLLLNDN